MIISNLFHSKIDKEIEGFKKLLAKRIQRSSKEKDKDPVKANLKDGKIYISFRKPQEVVDFGY